MYQFLNFVRFFKKIRTTISTIEWRFFCSSVSLDSNFVLVRTLAEGSSCFVPDWHLYTNPAAPASQLPVIFILSLLFNQTHSTFQYRSNYTGCVSSYTLVVAAIFFCHRQGILITFADKFSAMQERPIDTTPVTVKERILDVVALILPLAGLALALVRYPELPDQIPVHFNGKGVADGYGSRATIFLLPAISMVMSAGLMLLARFPHQFNYMTTITPENASFEYKKARIMVRLLNAECAFLFFTAVLSVIQGTDGEAKLSPWFWVAFAATVITPFAILAGWQKKD